MRKKFIIALCIMLLLTAIPGIPTALASTSDGIVRVKISIGSPSQYSFLVDGNYSVNGAGLDRQLYTVKLEGGGVNLYYGTSKIAGGTSVKLIQHAPTSGRNNFIRMHNASTGNDYNYTGDMEFRIESGYIIAVNHVYIEDYLYGVVPYEMSDSWPIEALKAQAVAARGYALSDMRGSGAYDVGDTSRHQVYRGYNASMANAIAAVNATAKQAVTYGGTPIRTYFSASNGGWTDTPKNVWGGGTDLPYYQVQQDSFDAANPDSLYETVFLPKTNTEAQVSVSSNVGSMPNYQNALNYIKQEIINQKLGPGYTVYDFQLTGVTSLVAQAPASAGDVNYTEAIGSFSISIGSGTLSMMGVPESEPTATPVPSPEPTATPEPTVTPEPTTESTATPEPTVTPEPTTEPTATPEPTVTPEPTTEPSVNLTSAENSESSLTPEPTLEPTATPEPMPEPTATPEPMPEPTATPEPTPEPTATPEPTPEPTATPEPTPEPTATPQLTMQSLETNDVQLTKEGALVTNVKLYLHYFDGSNGNNMYKTFNKDSLRLFVVKDEGTGFTISKKRYGHGVGLSQRGAQQRAHSGQSYQQILGFYYPNTSLTTQSYNRPSLTRISTPDTSNAYVTGTSTLNVRSGPTTSSGILGSLPGGARINVVQTDVATANGLSWHKIFYGGQYAYVAAKYVKTDYASGPVQYQSHVQNVGWQGWMGQGAVSGTNGQSLRLEAMRIKLNGVNGGIEYKTHVQNIGWMNWVKDGQLSGTEGRSLRLEAIQIRLTGQAAKDYDLYYRVHAQNFGWMGWAKNGSSAGTAGYSYRLEAIQVVMVPKGSKPPGSTSQSFMGSVSYQSHVQNIGWQDWKSNGSSSGTSGRSLRLEAMRMQLSGIDGGIEYKTHVQNIGWMNWVKDGQLSGTEGRSLRLEAIQIRLTGQAANDYDIYYRVHAQNFGWMGWAKNGGSAGTAGFSYRLEAIQIVLVPKGSGPPGSTAGSFVQK